jgi:hypothetical protein
MKELRRERVPRAPDDFAAIRARMEELRGQRAQMSAAEGPGREIHVILDNLNNSTNPTVIIQHAVWVYLRFTYRVIETSEPGGTNFA